MSIIWTLRKYIDSIEHREEESAQERDRRLARRQAPGDGGEGSEPALVSGPAALYECRVCGHRSSDEGYCPACLADTMVEVGWVARVRPYIRRLLATASGR
jgi:rubrerythrin